MIAAQHPKELLVFLANHNPCHFERAGGQKLFEKRKVRQNTDP